MPVLVLNGDLDVITPMSDATRAAALFPNATLVPVGNAVHVTALADFDDCAARIVRALPAHARRRRHALRVPRAELHVVRRFPRTAAARARRSAAARRRPLEPGDRRAAGRPRTPSRTRCRAGG